MQYVTMYFCIANVRIILLACSHKTFKPRPDARHSRTKCQKEARRVNLKISALLWQRDTVLIRFLLRLECLYTGWMERELKIPGRLLTPIPGDVPLSPCFNTNPPLFLCLNTLFVFTNYEPRQYNASYNRAFIVDWSLSGIMTLKLDIHDCEFDFTNDTFSGIRLRLFYLTK